MWLDFDLKFNVHFCFVLRYGWKTVKLSICNGILPQYTRYVSNQTRTNFPIACRILDIAMNSNICDRFIECYVPCTISTVYRHWLTQFHYQFDRMTNGAFKHKNKIRTHTVTHSHMYHVSCMYKWSRNIARTHKADQKYRNVKLKAILRVKSC